MIYCFHYKKHYLNDIDCAGDYESYQTESDDVSAKMMAAANKETCKYKESAKKIAFMVRRFEEDGFTAYWL